MRSERRVGLTIAGYGDESGAGVATVAEFDRTARLGRALKVLGASWAAAVVAVFIPVAHFILVPGLALFGAVAFARRVRTTAIVSALEGDCPNCGAVQQFDAGGRWYLPRSLQCGSCRRTLKATLRST